MKKQTAEELIKELDYDYNLLKVIYESFLLSFSLPSYRDNLNVSNIKYWLSREETDPFCNLQETGLLSDEEDILILKYDINEIFRNLKFI